MEPDTQPTGQEPIAPETAIEESGTGSLQAAEPEQPYRGLKWVFVGENGLRAGWSLAIFFLLFFAIASGLGRGVCQVAPSGRQGELQPEIRIFRRTASRAVRCWRPALGMR